MHAIPDDLARHAAPFSAHVSEDAGGTPTLTLLTPDPNGPGGSVITQSVPFRDGTPAGGSYGTWENEPLANAYVSAGHMLGLDPRLSASRESALHACLAMPGLTEADPVAGWVDTVATGLQARVDAALGSRGTLSPAARRVLTALAAAGGDHCRTVQDFLLASNDPGPFLAFLARNPVVGVAVLSTHEGRDAVAGGEDDASAFLKARDRARTGGEVDPASRLMAGLARWTEALRRATGNLRSDAAGAGPADLLDTIPNYPVEWVPSAGQVGAILHADACRAESLGRVGPLGDELRPPKGCGGDWVAYSDRLAEAAGDLRPRMLRHLRPVTGKALSRCVGRFIGDVAVPLRHLHPEAMPTFGRLADAGANMGWWQLRDATARVGQALMAGTDLAGRHAMARRHERAVPAVVGAVARHPRRGEAGPSASDVDMPILRDAAGREVAVTRVGRSLRGHAGGGVAGIAVSAPAVHVHSWPAGHRDGMDGSPPGPGGEDPRVEVTVTLPAATREGSIDASLRLCRPVGGTTVDPAAVAASALGVAVAGLGDAILEAAGLSEAYRLRPAEPRGSFHPSYEPTEEAVCEVLAAWHGVLPHRMRRRSPQEVAEAIEEAYAGVVKADERARDAKTGRGSRASTR